MVDKLVSVFKVQVRRSAVVDSIKGNSVCSKIRLLDRHSARSQPHCADIIGRRRS